MAQEVQDFSWGETQLVERERHPLEEDPLERP